MNKSNERSCRIIASISVLMICVVCALITHFVDFGTTPIQIFGAFAAVIAVSVVTWKFPLRFSIAALIFTVFAAPMGSVINLYQLVPFYDRAVHYLSGILLAEGGMIIVEYIFKKCYVPTHKTLILLFSFLFSCACAGFWEIYEFCADTFLGADCQGDNTNTMGDIVSGVLGAVTYLIVGAVNIRIKEKNKNK